MPTNKGIEYIVLDSIAATAGDVTFDAGRLKVGNSTVGTVDIPYKKILNPGGWKKQAKVSETAQVSTGTPTANNSDTYWVIINQTIANGENYTKKYDYVSDATATATEIVTGLKAAINADPRVKVTASGTTTLVLTADTGYSQFIVSQSSNIAMVATTPGVYAVNTGQLLYDAGFTSATTSNNYTTYTVITEEAKAASNPNTFSIDRKTYMVLANEGDGDITAFAAAMDNAGTADDGSGVADSDAIAVV